MITKGGSVCFPANKRASADEGPVGRRGCECAREWDVGRGGLKCYSAWLSSVALWMVHILSMALLPLCPR